MQHLDVDDPAPKLSAHWKDAWIINQEQKGALVVVPAPERYVAAKELSVRRFFIFTTSGNHISDGRIVEFVGENYDVTSNIDLLLGGYNSSYISGFTGAILQYDVNYTSLSSTSFKGGNVDNHNKATIISQYGGTDGDISGIGRQRALVLSQSMGRPRNGGLDIMAFRGCDPVTPQYFGFPTNIPAGCTVYIWEQVTYYEGCITSVTYTFMSMDCPGGVSNQGSGSGGGSEDPPYGGGGGNPTPLLSQILNNASQLSPQQKNQLNALLAEMNGSCTGLAIFEHLAASGYQHSIKMSVDPNLTDPATYNPNTNAVTFKNTGTLEMWQLREELFHAYQNMIISGGTAQYLTEGRANIEFEAKLVRDLSALIEGTQPSPLAMDAPEYYSFLDTLTNGYTEFPRNIANLSLPQYYNLLNILSLKIQGIIQLILNLTCRRRLFLT